MKKATQNYQIDNLDKIYYQSYWQTLAKRTATSLSATVSATIHVRVEKMRREALGTVRICWSTPSIGL